MSLANVALDRLEGDQAAHSGLDNLDVEQLSDPKRRHRGIDELVARFLLRYPGGFTGDTYFKEERAYKQKGVKLAQELLGREALADLSDAGDSEEIIHRAKTVLQATNLVFPNEKMALNDALKRPEHRQAFADALVYHLHSDESHKVRLERFVRCLEDLEAAKWTTATYFWHLYVPEEHMFMKPRYAQDAAAVCRWNLRYDPQPNWRTYEALQGFANYLRALLAERGHPPLDMLDIHSFVWQIGQE